MIFDLNTLIIWLFLVGIFLYFDAKGKITGSLFICLAAILQIVKLFSKPTKNKSGDGVWDNLWDNLDKKQYHDKESIINAINQGAKKLNQGAPPPEMDSIIRGILKELAPIAVSNMGISLKEFNKRLVNISVKKTSDINGMVYSNDKKWNTFSIEINVGIMIFIHKLFKIFASQAITMDKDTRTTYSKKVSLNKLVPIVKEILDCHINGNILSASGLPLKELSSGQIFLNSELVRGAELFTVSHELGHLTYNLNKNFKQYVEISPNEHIDSIIQNWNNEINCDVTGFYLCMSTNNERKAIIYYAIELFFITLKMLEEYHEKVKGVKMISITHPPSDLRLKALRKIVGESGHPEWVKECSFFEDISKTFMTKIC